MRGLSVPKQKTDRVLIVYTSDSNVARAYRVPRHLSLAEASKVFTEVWDGLDPESFDCEIENYGFRLLDSAPVWLNQ